MYCKNCGNKIDDDSKFCCQCGKEVKNSSYEDEKYKAPDGKEYNVKNGVLYGDDGWSTGKAPYWWDHRKDW